MSFHLGVWARDESLETRLATELSEAARGMIEVKISTSSSSKSSFSQAQVVLVDANMPAVDEKLASLERGGKAVFLIVGETMGGHVPNAFAHGLVDDVLIHPFRPLEVLSKLLRYQQLMMWDEVGKLNASFSELLARLQEDVKVAERLQKRVIPKRFPDIKGFQVVSRYLAGMKAGGDHFDLAESKDGGTLSLMLSDSSTYGLSSALLSVLMSVAMKLSGDQLRSSAEVVSRIRDELMLTLGERDKLSLFYGVLSRKDYRLRFLNLGDSKAYYAPQGEEFAELPSQGEALAFNSYDFSGEGELALLPGSRLALISDGFIEVAGGAKEAKDLLNQFRSKESLDGLNEFVFQVKKKFEDPDDMPAQDCTAIVLDMNANVLRLAP